MWQTVPKKLDYSKRAEPFLGLSARQKFSVTDGGDTLLFYNKRGSLRCVDLTIPPSRQVAMAVPEYGRYRQK